MITLKKYGIYFVSTVIATSSAFWYARNGADVKAVDIAGLIDVATRYDLKERDDTYITAYLSANTTSVLRADVARLNMDTIDSFVDSFTSTVGKYKSDSTECAEIVDGYEFAEILVEPESKPTPASTNSNEVTYFYDDSMKYSTNGIPVSVSLWTFTTTKSDGTLRFKSDIPTNQSPVASMALGIIKCASSNTSERVNAVWPTNDVEAVGYWPYENGWSLMDAPLRVEKVVAYGIKSAYTNDYLNPSTSPIRLTFGEITNQVFVITNSTGSAYTNRFNAPPEGEQRYALYNVGLKGVTDSSWLNHYGTIGMASDITLDPTDSLMYANKYAVNAATGTVGTITFSTLVPINSGSRMQVQVIAGDFAPVTFTAGINTNIADGSLNHTVTYTGLNSGTYYNTQLYRFYITGATNSYNSVIVSISSIPSITPSFSIVIDEASKIFRDGEYFNLSMNYDRLNSTQSNMVRSVSNPQVKRSNLDAFKWMIDTNSASVHFLDYGSGWTVKSQNVTTVLYAGSTTNNFSGTLPDDATLDQIFNSPSTTTETNDLTMGYQLYVYRPSQRMIYSKTLTNMSPAAYSEISSASSGASENIAEKTVQISWPSVWAITNGLVKRVRAYAICDQRITGNYYNPYLPTNAEYSVSFGGSTAVNSDELFDIANYFVNRCDYTIDDTISSAHFPKGSPVTSSMGTLVYDNSSISTATTNLLSFTLPTPTATTLAIPKKAYQDINYNFVTNVGAIAKTRTANHDSESSLVIRKLVVVVDWNPISWTEPTEE